MNWFRVMVLIDTGGTERLLYPVSQPIPEAVRSTRRVVQRWENRSGDTLPQIKNWQASGVSSWEHKEKGPHGTKITYFRTTDEPGWFVELNSVDELIALMTKYGGRVRCSGSDIDPYPCNKPEDAPNFHFPGPLQNELQIEIYPTKFYREGK